MSGGRPSRRSLLLGFLALALPAAAADGPIAASVPAAVEAVVGGHDPATVCATGCRPLTWPGDGGRGAPQSVARPCDRPRHRRLRRLRPVRPGRPGAGQPAQRGAPRRRRPRRRGRGRRPRRAGARRSPREPHRRPDLRLPGAGTQPAGDRRLPSAPPRVEDRPWAGARGAAQRRHPRRVVRVPVRGGPRRRRGGARPPGGHRLAGRDRRPHRRGEGLLQSPAALRALLRAVEPGGPRASGRPPVLLLRPQPARPSRARSPRAASRTTAASPTRAGCGRPGSPWPPPRASSASSPTSTTRRTSRSGPRPAPSWDGCSRGSTGPSESTLTAARAAPPAPVAIALPLRLGPRSGVGTLRVGYGSGAFVEAAWRW